MKEFDFDVVFYGLYVDDTYVIMPSDKVNFILTYEIEQDPSLNFLDLLRSGNRMGI